LAYTVTEQQSVDDTTVVANLSKFSKQVTACANADSTCVSRQLKFLAGAAARSERSKAADVEKKIQILASAALNLVQQQQSFAALLDETAKDLTALSPLSGPSNASGETPSIAWHPIATRTLAAKAASPLGEFLAVVLVRKQFLREAETPGSLERSLAGGEVIEAVAVTDTTVQVRLANSKVTDRERSAIALAELSLSANGLSAADWIYP
jgi:hypothetical protein